MTSTVSMLVATRLSAQLLHNSLAEGSPKTRYASLQRWQNSLVTSTHQLPIYPAPDPELVLVETHSVLEQQITKARCAVTATYSNAYARIQSVVDRWIGVEHAIERRIKSIVTPEEPLTPGLLYVGVATLTGSVLARNRSLLLRFTLPPALFLVSMNHFLPQTSHNISNYLSSLERAHAPGFADAHARFSQRFASTSSAARHAWYNSRDKTLSSVERGVTTLQDRTGLKLREALGWGQKPIAQPRASTTNVADVVDEKIGDLRK